ncbi:12174_t:CDS:1 [Racocetra fulgida]|uniref:12174_t:CDS:1 n=1 Tax=Racocetra fulgida TaxID=60492 RepID=A0A9N9BZF8_9GLOM|nr:12174_t:CDS:1 [Racocetra fulgida]
MDLDFKPSIASLSNNCEEREIMLNNNSISSIPISAGPSKICENDLNLVENFNKIDLDNSLNILNFHSLPIVPKVENMDLDQFSTVPSTLSNINLKPPIDSDLNGKISERNLDSTNDSRFDSRFDSRNDSRIDSRNNSRSDSRNNSKNDLRNDSRDNSRNDSRNNPRNDSRNDPRND